MSDVLEKARRFHRRDSASRYLEQNWGLRCKAKTLAKLAVCGGGPPMRYMGRWPVYSEADLDHYATSRLSGPFNSTMERDRAQRGAAQ
jgi:hypothetical protein